MLINDMHQNKQKEKKEKGKKEKKDKWYAILKR